MQVDISKAGLVALTGSLLTTISTVKQGFKVTTNKGYLLFASVMDLCRDLGIRPEDLRAAVEAEGYEIDGHDIRPLAKNVESEPNEQRLAKKCWRCKGSSLVAGDGEYTTTTCPECEFDMSEFGAVAQSRERPHSRSMRVSLEGAGLTTKIGSSLTWILVEDWRFKVGVSSGAFHGFDALDDLCQDLGVDEEALRAAVLAKGYEIVEGDICPLWIDGSLLTDSERAAIAVAALLPAPAGVEPHLWTAAKALNTSIDDLLCVRGAGAEKVKVLRTFAKTCRFHTGRTRVERTSEGVFDRIPSLAQSEPVEGRPLQVSLNDIGWVTSTGESLAWVLAGGGKFQLEGDLVPEWAYTLTDAERAAVSRESLFTPPANVNPDLWTVAQAMNTSIDDLLSEEADVEKVHNLCAYAKEIRKFLEPPTPKESDGHQASDLETIAMDLARLVADKQRQYGDSAGRSGAILRILYPEGVKPDQYDRMLLVVRVLDKLSRLATHKADLGGESPWRDIMGYALLAVEKGF